MKIIADSSASRTEWALVDGATVVEHAFTKGLNPFFHTRRDISHSIRLELPEAFFKRRWERIHFYGAGCTSPEKKKIVEASLVAQFKTPLTVESDLLGAARGLLINEAGIACILGSGSNSCYYDGRAIVKNVRSLGSLLGGEGRAAPAQGPAESRAPPRGRQPADAGFRRRGRGEDRRRRKDVRGQWRLAPQHRPAEH